MNFKKSVLQFSIRKLSIGVASIAIGSIFMNASIASANTIAPSKANTSTNSIVQPKEMNQNNQIQPTIGTKQTQNNENNKATAPDILTLTGKMPNDTSSIKQNQFIEKKQLKKQQKSINL